MSESLKISYKDYTESDFNELSPPNIRARNYYERLGFTESLNIHMIRVK